MFSSAETLCLTKDPFINWMKEVILYVLLIYFTVFIVIYISITIIKSPVATMKLNKEINHYS
jgi:hypothetical protein